MLGKFFRKDLNLQNYWWHRLLFVIFFISAVPIIVFLTKKNLENFEFPKYKEICKLKDRLDSRILSIDELIQPQELCAYSLSELYLPGSRFFKEYWKKDRIYCSKSIAYKLDELSKVIGVYLFYADNKECSKDIFADNLIKYNTNFVNVIEKDETYYKEHYITINRGYDDYGIFKVSISQSIIYILFLILRLLFLIGLGFTTICTFYYKIVIYIIFGNRK